MGAVGWVFTANEVSSLPAPFRSRVQTLKMPEPGPEHLPQLMTSIRHEFAREDGIDARWLHSLDLAETAAITECYAEHRSVRLLKEQLRQLLDLRELRMH